MRDNQRPVSTSPRVRARHRSAARCSTTPIAIMPKTRRKWAWPGWTVYLDLNGSGTLDTDEPQQISDDDGRYVFLNVEPLTHYTIAEVWQDNWEQTYPAAADNYVWSVDPTAGEIITDRDFGNFDLTTGGQGTDGVLAGRVFRDDDGDRVQDPTESGLIGYTVYLD